MKKRPALPTDDELRLGSHSFEPQKPIKVIPTARFSHFPFDLVARYVNHKVEFTVEKDMSETPWTVRKLT